MNQSKAEALVVGMPKHKRYAVVFGMPYYFFYQNKSERREKEMESN
ncbi:hypothetical protein [Bacillus tuaregi]|nr:hypothetical protein [Bacillus tuaregi]